MAITVGTITTSANTHTFSHNVAAGSNRLLVVLVAMHSGSGILANGIKYNDVQMTLAKNQTGNYREVAIYYLVNPDVGNYNVVAHAYDNGYGIDYTAISLTGVDTGSPYTGTSGSNGASYTPSVEVTSSVDDLVLDVVAYCASTETTHFVPGDGQTERSDFRTEVSSGVAMGVSTKAGGASTQTTSWTASDVVDNNYAMASISLKSYIDLLDIDMSEGLSLADTENSWANPERMSEGITLSEALLGGYEFLLSISEDITFAETIGFLMTYTKDISDSFNLAETLNIEQLDDLTEGLSLADVLQCPYWSETLSEAFSALDIAQVENRNVTWRQEKSLNMVGQHIQLKFYNNTLDQSLYLRDIKMYFDRWEDRKAIEAGDYVGEHVRITFRNNVVDESLYLEYVRIIGIFRGLLGWSV